jgi:hypothetical protein
MVVDWRLRHPAIRPDRRCHIDLAPSLMKVGPSPLRSLFNVPTASGIYSAACRTLNPAIAQNPFQKYLLPDRRIKRADGDLWPPDRVSSRHGKAARVHSRSTLLGFFDCPFSLGSDAHIPRGEERRSALRKAVSTAQLRDNRGKLNVQF